MPHPCALDPAAVGCVDKEQLVETANSALLKVLQYLESAETFAGEQVPLLVEEVLHYTIFMHSVKFAIGALLLSWGVFAIRWARRNAEARMSQIEEHTCILKRERLNRDERTQDTEDVIFSLFHYGVPISGVFTLVIGLLMFVGHAFALVKPLIAPRLFLLDYFRALIR